MKFITLLSLITSLSLTFVAHATDFGSVPDPYTGNWSGTLVTPGQTQPLHATIIPYKDRFEVTFRAEPNPRAEAIVILSGKVKQNKLVLEPAPIAEAAEASAARAGNASTRTPPWQGQAKGVELKGNIMGSETGTFSLKKVPFQPSPTLGQNAPAGATILFDGNGLAAWESKQAPADPIQWLVTDAKTLEVVSHRDGKRNKQDLKTKATFGDYRLHLEFNLAHKPDATGQGRSNSGVIHHGVYETQILDSFGLYGRDNECGGIYKTREPDSNAGFPAGLWQTYDFEVKAPRFDAQGNKTSDARMTVRLNGTVVHQAVTVPKPTAGGKEAARGPIVLQDHGSPVQFRNIWLVKLD